MPLPVQACVFPAPDRQCNTLATMIPRPDRTPR